MLHTARFSIFVARYFRLTREPAIFRIKHDAPFDRLRL